MRHIVIASFITVLGKISSLQVEQIHRTANVGETVDLPCNSGQTQASLKNVRWSKGQSDSFVAQWYSDMDYSSIIPDKFSLQNAPALTIRNVRSEDAEEYHCKVRYVTPNGEVVKDFNVQLYILSALPLVATEDHLITTRTSTPPDTSTTAAETESSEVTLDPTDSIATSQGLETNIHNSTAANVSLSSADFSPWKTIIRTESNSTKIEVEPIEPIQKQNRSSFALWFICVVVVVVLVIIVATLVKLKVTKNENSMQIVSEDAAIRSGAIPRNTDVPRVERNEMLPPIPDTNAACQSNTMCSPTEDGNDRWEFEMSKLKFNTTSILGRGEFGEVRQADVEDIADTKGITKVAVKSLKGNATEDDKQNFMREMEIMKSFKLSHPHVIMLYGCCTKIGSICIIMEIAPNGSLQNYLRKNRSDSSYQNLHANSRNISPFALLQFAWQIAMGMNFLTSHQCIHRDLATRNILLGVNNICKISDFGFARKVSGTCIYEIPSEGTKLPIRWMAIESLCESIYTSKSDVWSYGITLWEIVTLGSTPYGYWSSSEVLKMLKRGYRKPKPKHCSEDIYSLMLNCWNSNPTERPSFSDLNLMVGKLASDATKEYLSMQDFENHKYINLQAMDIDSKEKL